MARSAAIAVYVSGHGFGHAVRVGEVLDRLARRRPTLTMHVCSAAPASLFPDLPGRLVHRPVALDVGMVQRSGVEVDFAATLSRLHELDTSWDERCAAETAWLESIRAVLVLGDVPALAFAASERAGVPSLALANFTWEWVYATYAERDSRFARHAARAAAAYRAARCLLRLPFHAPTTAFESIADLPLIARRRSESIDEARRRLDLPRETPLVLVSFGGHGQPELDERALARMQDVAFVSTGGFALRASNLLARPQSIDYALLLRACDAVLTKPGYGIVADSLANGVRLLCVRRDDFPEAAILERALLEHGTAELVTAADLASGRIREPLERLLARPAAPAELDVDGAERAADRLEQELDG
jgi:L-arabinokinase